MMKYSPLSDIEVYPPFDGFPKEGIRFLKQLKKNNNRGWFAKHKSEYENYVKFPMQSLIAALEPHFEKFAPEIDVNPKRSMFRIYRDTRFSKDKTPYKVHLAAVFHLKGHWQESAGFYLHIEPGEVYVGGGIYMPDNSLLKKIRTALIERADEFLEIIGDAKFVKRFGDVEGDKLQRIPQGFPSNHWMGEWLKFKQFLASVSWGEEVCYSPKFTQKIVSVYKDLYPLIRFLNDALGET